LLCISELAEAFAPAAAPVSLCGIVLWLAPLVDGVVLLGLLCGSVDCGLVVVVLVVVDCVVLEVGGCAAFGFEL
jgi:hypothetical protein